MIKSFYIDNFKSLVDFRLPPAPHQLGLFTCLVGLNGAGKSTVLQALDFLGYVGSGGVSDWLELREWSNSDLTSRFLKKQLITFKLEFEFEQLGRVTWEASFNSVLQRCTSELITVGNDHVLVAKDQKLFARLSPPPGKRDVPALTQNFELQNLSYQGSTLSLLKSGRWHAAIEAVRESLEMLKSLEMLSPQAMRQRSRDGGDIGYGGERLAAYIHGMTTEQKQRLISLLKGFYPSVEGMTTRAFRAGWKELSVGESYLDAAEKPLHTSAKQLNDGLLRVLAVLAQVEIGLPAETSHSDGQPEQQVKTGCVLFDEIENGINPELVEKLVQSLLSAERQVIVTTHSPLLLNYLPDEVAKEGVLLLFRNSVGHTKVVRLFDLPSTQKKLTLLGPGEVFVDTHLEALPAEAMTLLDAQES